MVAGAPQPSAFPAPERPVAGIVSPAWDNESRRDDGREAARVIAALGIGPGQTVADIGAGTGYYTVRLSPVVGPEGEVIAQDIMPEYLRDLEVRVAAAGLENVSFVRGTEADPMLPASRIDTALMIHMYHEIGQPYALLTRLRSALKPGAKLGIVDLEREPLYHGMPRTLLVCELKAVGYDLVSITDLTSGYLAIFTPGTPPPPATVKACRR